MDKTRYRNIITRTCVLVYAILNKVDHLHDNLAPNQISEDRVPLATLIPADTRALISCRKDTNVVSYMFIIIR